MYYIKKYADCWAVHDDVTGASRKLTATEIEKVKIEFDSLNDEKVLTIYADRIRSICVIEAKYENLNNKIN
jgi:hypothetical protein